jgi:UDP-N-acetyl-D-mannosaminuronate dehydrogenase
MKELINNKKRIATIIGVAALPLAAALTFNQGMTDNGGIDVELANIEALAQGEIVVEKLCMYSYGNCDYGDIIIKNGVLVK